MKKTLTNGQMARELLNDEYASWSYNGAYALIEWLENLEEDCGEEVEFDCVAIRCDFSKWSNAIDCASQYNYELEGDDDEEKEENALEWLNKQAPVIKFDGGIIIQDF